MPISMLANMTLLEVRELHLTTCTTAIDVSNEVPMNGYVQPTQRSIELCIPSQALR